MDNNSTDDDYYVLDPNVVPPPPPILYYPGVPDEVTPTTSATSSQARPSPESSTESDRRSGNALQRHGDEYHEDDLVPEDASYPSRHAHIVDEGGTSGNSGSWDRNDGEASYDERDFIDTTIQTDTIVSNALTLALVFTLPLPFLFFLSFFPIYPEKN